MGQSKPINRSAILVVEDEALIRYDLVDFFELGGLTVYEAENADEAIRILETHPELQIVLTDVQMPGAMDGIKLAAYIRDRWPPALLFVASGMLNPDLSGLPIDARFLVKPFDPRLVLREIRAV